MAKNIEDTFDSKMDSTDIYNYILPNGIKIDYQPVQPTVNAHYHSFIELFYILKGKIQHEFNGSFSILQEGDFALIDVKSFHKFTKIKGSNCSLINLLFLPTFIDPSLNADSDFNSVISSRTINQKTLPSHVAINQIYHESENEIRRILLCMHSEFFNAQYKYLEVLKSLLKSLLIHILRYMSNDNMLTSGSDSIDIAIDYINKNYQDNITLDDVSALLHYTPQYFSTKFKKITGVNFSHYLQSVRIAHSCQLLQFTNIKISEIATLVGYQDLKQFEFVFRKHTDRTPMQHRQFCRQNREIQFILQ